MMTDILLSNPMWVWLFLAVAFLVIEVITLGLTTIWFTGGAVAAIVCVALGGGWNLSIVVFLVVSILLLMLVRPFAKKKFNIKRVRTNAESLIGNIGIVFEEIDNLKANGRVAIGGSEWAARSNIDDVKIPIGSKVRVLSIVGVKLIVELVREEK